MARWRCTCLHIAVSVHAGCMFLVAHHLRSKLNQVCGKQSSRSLVSVPFYELQIPVQGSASLLCSLVRPAPWRLRIPHPVMLIRNGFLVNALVYNHCTRGRLVPARCARLQAELLRPELLEGDNQFFCESCERKVSGALSLSHFWRSEVLKAYPSAVFCFLRFGSCLPLAAVSGRRFVMVPCWKRRPTLSASCACVRSLPTSAKYIYLRTITQASEKTL